MQQQFRITGQATQVASLQQNKVLRNTYALLALSMIPTVIGALVGVQMGFSFFAGSPMISFMVFLGVAFGFMWGIERTKNSGMGVVLLLGFTFFMGLMLSRILQVVLLAAVANIFFQIPALSLTISAVAVLVFSAYILYDISRIVNGGETNYISATLAVYLDVYNVFVSLLNLLMAFSGERD